MLAFVNLVQEHTTLILCLRLLCGTSYLTLHSSVDYCELCRQLEELQQQCSAQQTEIRRLYDWKDVMKTAHNEHLQELASKHQVDRDTLLADISHRYPPLCFAAYSAHQDQPVGTCQAGPVRYMLLSSGARQKSFGHKLAGPMHVDTYSAVGAV